MRKVLYRVYTIPNIGEVYDKKYLGTIHYEQEYDHKKILNAARVYFKQDATQSLLVTERDFDRQRYRDRKQQRSLAIE